MRFKLVIKKFVNGRSVFLTHVKNGLALELISMYDYKHNFRAKDWSCYGQTCLLPLLAR